MASQFAVNKAELTPGLYRNITGNQAVAWGLVAAAQRSGCELFYGSYPITPASDILHELVRHKNFGVRTFQAEDEIAAVTSAIGAAFGGAMGVTASSGPGIALKTEAIGLAVMTELPLLIINVQRGGPSTGLPTKTEQADLLQAMFGRNGECPVPIVAASQPGRLLRRGVRSLADRRAVHDARVPADRRLYRQRRRAVESARGRQRCRRSTVKHPQRQGKRRGVSCPTPATSGWRGPGPCRARRA